MVDLAITIARMQMATEDAERCFNMFILIRDIINILQMTTLICPSDHDSLVTLAVDNVQVLKTIQNA